MIAISWQEKVAAAVDVIRRKFNGHTGTAAKRIFAPMPVIRTSI